MCQRRRGATADNGWGFVDERVVLKGLDHEQGEIHAARDVAGKDGIADMPTPHGQTLTLALFEVASAYDRPAGGAFKDPTARFDLVVNIREGDNARDPARDLLLLLQGRRVHVPAIAGDVPTAGKDETRAWRCKVEYRLSGPRRVMLIAPGNQHGENSVTPGDGFSDHFAVVRRARDDGDVSFERVKFAHASFSTNADHFIAPIQRVLDHVPAKFSRGSNDADFHFYLQYYVLVLQGWQSNAGLPALKHPSVILFL